ncbi:hypothetical protein EVAR_78041_1 [Eumeta japonica]|uniref:Uncharacterized protein n=1 Tax=Eumeta variegata TaxID=151549 RepID=A0A4C1T340_EUMVA|nr:hypothetical protein EVAR_78041_1 [Eumeta japonica]
MLLLYIPNNTLSRELLMLFILRWDDGRRREGLCDEALELKLKLTCCMLLAAVALCSAAPPERHPPAEQEQVADVYDAILIVPRPDLASLGPASAKSTSENTGFAVGGSFGFLSFLQSSFGTSGGIGAGERKGSGSTD